MNLIVKIEKHFGSWAIPGLTIYLIAVQGIGAIMLMTGRADEVDLMLHGASVLNGQWWRLFSFLMLPKTTSPVWLLFAGYIFYFIGTALERKWSVFRFNLFIFSGYLLTVIMAFVNPGAVIMNTFFMGSVFLAFATLFPDVEFRLFFVLPVKVKWLGWLTSVLYGMLLFSADSGSRLGVAAALINYLFFFGKGFFLSLHAGQRRKSFRAAQEKTGGQPMHQCAACGITDTNVPSADFRYCSTCGRCYCSEHIDQHDHRK